MAKQTKATHQGHCQVCSRVHNVQGRNGKIAKHGYTVDYGFFNGTCPGSEHLPLEQDTTVTEKYITWAEQQREQWAGISATWKLPVTNAAQAWFNVYITEQTRRGPRSHYTWKLVPIFEHTANDYTTFTRYAVQGEREFKDGENVRVRTTNYDYSIKTLDQFANSQNTKYAELVADREVEHLTSYMREQRENIARYHGQPLLPIATELPIVGGVVLVNVQTKEYVEFFQRAQGQMGSRMRPSVTFTSDRSKAKVFTKRAASLAQQPLYLFNMKSMTEPA